MDILEGIVSRRSIRKYKPDLVPEDDVKTLLEAAMSAPSAGNEQPWEFVVIDDRRLLGAIPTVHPYSRMLDEAPLAILVCGNLHQEKHKGYWVQDCSAATQNLLLAAHGLGLGAVWLGVYPRDDRVAGVRRLLSLPDYIVPLALVSLGYPAEQRLPAERYKPDRVHHNGW